MSKKGDSQISTGQIDGAPAKKGRGRPPKDASQKMSAVKSSSAASAPAPAPATATVVVPAPDIPAKKPKGRPSGAKLAAKQPPVAAEKPVVTEKAAAAVKPASKAKSGVAAKPQKQAATEKLSAASVVSAATAPVPAVTTEKSFESSSSQKKRGRPRIYPAIDEADRIKRPRGRPRKEAGSKSEA